jgi:hypothetical protein
MAIVAERSARDEALLRAFESSGADVAAFAGMYGLDPKAAARSLERARRLRPGEARQAPPAPARPSPAR